MSYFDEQYGGENETEPTIKGGASDDEEEEEELEDAEEDAEEDVEEEEIDDDEAEEELDEEDDEEDEHTQTGGADTDDEKEDGEDDDGEGEVVANTKIKKIPAKNVYKKPIDFIDNDEDDDADGEQYLQKFNSSSHENYLLNFHPESISQNYDEIISMTKVVRNDVGIIIDKLHKTIPFLTKYEKARILGQRAKQINSGAYPFIKVPENVIDGYIIAEIELKQKKIPFIIRRPLPNGGSEYWKVHDLEDISF
jgi:DNA-directed RNA polymerase I, II, and III subunit RPABC2